VAGGAHHDAEVAAEDLPHGPEDEAVPEQRRGAAAAGGGERGRMGGAGGGAGLITCPNPTWNGV